jgi:hypothetical protein
MPMITSEDREDERRFVGDLFRPSQNAKSGADGIVSVGLMSWLKVSLCLAI